MTWQSAFTLHEDPQKLHIGTLEPHAYFIPFARGQAQGERECSVLFTSLCGNWDFDYYERLDELPDDLLTRRRPQRSRCRPTGSFMAMASRNIRMSVFQSLTIPHMYRMITLWAYIGAVMLINRMETVVCWCLKA